MDHIQLRTSSPEPGTPTRTVAWRQKPHLASPEDQGTRNVNVSCSRDQRSGTLATDPTRAVCSTHTARPMTTAQHHEGTTPGTTHGTKTDRKTGTNPEPFPAHGLQ